MSRAGDCWDNAVAESFCATLERELLMRERLPTRAIGHAALAEFIERWYNRHRRHLSLGYRSPMPYERDLRHQVMAA